MTSLLLIRRDRNAILIWLTLCAVLVAGMVLVGGYTRLSGSGLSITDWKPVHGVIPPLNEAQWEEEFTLYKHSPQFQKVNRGMELAEFKTIFWPEYWHRVLGRSIGFVFLLPMLVFLARRSITFRLALRLSLIFALGGVQGFIGWFMVKSGLIDDPFVSPLRLALHLSIAFAIFSALLWTFWDIARPWAGPTALKSGAKRAFHVLFALLCVQILYGALVAGLKAGLIYNTFPTMNGQWIPPEIGHLTPWTLNLYHNVATVQFIHRMGAFLLVIFLPLWWCIFLRDGISKPVKRAGWLMIAALAAQFTLGVLTLVHQVPLDLALAHQMTALLLLATMVSLLHAFTTRA